MTIRLTDEMKKDMIEIIELHRGYFGGNVDHLLSAIQGVHCEKHISAECRKVIGLVEDTTGVQFSALKSPTRVRNISIARQFAMYKLHQKFYSRGYTLQQIGKMFNRDHSTVLHSVKTVQWALQVGDELMTSINERYKLLDV